MTYAERSAIDGAMKLCNVSRGDGGFATASRLGRKLVKTVLCLPAEIRPRALAEKMQDAFAVECYPNARR